MFLSKLHETFSSILWKFTSCFSFPKNVHFHFLNFIFIIGPCGFIFNFPFWANEFPRSFSTLWQPMCVARFQVYITIKDYRWFNIHTCTWRKRQMKERFRTINTHLINHIYPILLYEIQPVVNSSPMKKWHIFFVWLPDIISRFYQLFTSFKNPVSWIRGKKEA